MQAAELTAEFGIAGILDFVETEHGLVKAAISLDGISGELFLQGAHLTAWQPPGERPVLFTSPNSAFAPGRAIRGGIPIIFPWFGASRHQPAAPQHGFARTAPWRLDGVETAGDRHDIIKLGRDRNDGYWLLKAVRARANPGDVERLLLNTAEQDGKRVRIGFGQDPGQAGKSQALHLVRALRSPSSPFLFDRVKKQRVRS